MVRWLSFLALFTFGCTTKSGIKPTIEPTENSINNTMESALPKGWVPVDASHFSHNKFVKNDLNKDGVHDWVGYVVKDRATAFAVILSQKKGFDLYMLRNDLQPRELTFDPVRGVLKLSFEGGGSAGSDALDAKFRFQNSDIFLIGLTRTTDMNTPDCDKDNTCGYQKEDTNFLTGFSIYSSSTNGRKIDYTKKEKINQAPSLVNLKNFSETKYLD